MQKTKMIFVTSVKIVLILSLSMIVLFSCKKNENPDSLDRDTSYAFGMLLANQLTRQMGMPKFHFDYKAFMEGFRDYTEENETRLTQDEAVEKINALFNQLQAREEEEMWLKGAENREEGEAYLAMNGARSGVITTASGLQYEVITQGSGEKPGLDDLVRVNYEGTFINGEVFDSSSLYGQPAEFYLNSVIPGWIEGLQLMSEGSVYRFVIPYDLAYGPSGAGPIPPSSTLVFKVELLSIIKQD